MADIEDLKENAGTLIDFATDPLGFIREYVALIIVGGLLTMFRQVISVSQHLYQTTRNAVFVQSGSAIASSLATVGSIPFMILGEVNDLLVTGAQAGGPLAPVVYVFAWTVLLVVVVEALQAVWRSIVVVT